MESFRLIIVMFSIRPASLDDMPSVLNLYISGNYVGSFSESDVTYVATLNRGDIVGVVRREREYGVSVLRGMQVHEDFRRIGIGRSLLQYFTQQLGSSACFCIPYRHLINFYGAAHFRVLSSTDAPTFLTERMNDYLKNNNGKEYVLMYRPSLFACEFQDWNWRLRNWVDDNTAKFYYSTCALDAKQLNCLLTEF